MREGLNTLTGKAAYDERKRLNSENKLRREQKEARDMDDREKMDLQIEDFFSDLRRIADAMEKLAAR